MIAVMAEVLARCREVLPESYYLGNSSPNPTYPYLVCSYDGDAISWDRDGAYLDIDVFHNQGTDQEEIEDAVHRLRNHLKHHRVMLDSCYLRFRYEGSNTMDTLSDSLQRRHVRFYITIDWREE